MMPLFVCEECGVVENTALSNYWTRKTADQSRLCSQCDPLIQKWHGVFPRQTMADAEYVELKQKPFVGRRIWEEK
jgi:hypothetical protein